MVSKSPRYSICPADPAGHNFVVSILIPDPAPEQMFWLPAWIPGSYMVRDFARHIIGLQATDNTGAHIELEQLDKQTWRAHHTNTSVLKLTYQVYAWDLSVRTAFLDQSRAFFNGSSVFLAVKGREQDPCLVHIAPPAEPVDGVWRVATALPALTVDPYGFGEYQAESYDALIDHPVEISDHQPGTFHVNNVPHQIVLSGRHNADTDRLQNDLQKICQQHINFWQIPAPMDQYVFMTAVVGSGAGGLEHRASTALMASRNDLPYRGMKDTTSGYRNYLSLCSHEYFHTWNVKRLKPRRFIPYQLDKESYTELLWWFEGITSYYDDLGVVRAGCMSAEHYLEALAQTFTRVHRGVGRTKQSMAESSFNAWTKFYQQDENAANAIVSYYSKGALFALYLDLSIRQRTQGRQSLDDLVRAVWQTHSTDGVPERGIPVVAAQVIACDLSDVFALGLYDTEDLPLAPLLAEFGVQMIWGTPRNLQQPGGQSTQLKSDALCLGVRFEQHPLGAKVAVVHTDSPAHKAGISAGDIIIAIDQLQTDAARIDAQLARYQAGDKINIHLFRRDELREHHATLAVGAQTTCVLSLHDRYKVSLWLEIDA
ncbi:M61 family metallopeptidase [Salinispirillum marinum]|uniref:M61 family metallopeptidase n=2 Tax=Saccharospirillaceae TaxID=255527 RepID=A0ABV8BA08_9GAMM